MKTVNDDAINALISTNTSQIGAEYRLGYGGVVIDGVKIIEISADFLKQYTCIDLFHGDTKCEPGNTSSTRWIIFNKSKQTSTLLSQETKHF